LSAAQKIACVEGIVHVPANTAGGSRQVANAKLFALQQGSVEVGQGKYNGAELSLQAPATTEAAAGCVIPTSAETFAKPVFKPVIKQAMPAPALAPAQCKLLWQPLSSCQW